MGRSRQEGSCKRTTDYFRVLRFVASKCLDILVPPRCISCNALIAEQSAICAQCWKEIKFIEPPYCQIMGTPFSYDLGGEIVSPEAIANPPPFARLRSAVLYDGIARKLITRYKFSDRSDLAPFLAKTMVRAGRELTQDADIIIPLPLHWRRLYSRRFNQAAQLAELLSNECQLDWDPLILTRIKNTRQQIGLTHADRRSNVAGAFKVKPEYKPMINGKRVLLIDDVYTSGATVKAATNTLLRAGASQVDILTFARVHSGII